MNPRPSLRPGLLSHRLDGQLMVYDKTDDNIHLLDGTTATVFELLEQGTGIGAIESKLDTQQTVAAGAELLALALDELAQARLLEGEERKSAPEMDNRRQALQKLAGVGAALLIPAIVTLVPRGAQAQASGVIGATCTHNFQCASGCCGSNSAGACTSNKCSPVPACGSCTP